MPFTAPMDHGRSQRSILRQTSTRSSWSWNLSIRWIPPPCRCSTSVRPTGQLVPLNAVAKLSHGCGTSHGKPPGTASLRDPFLQSQARCFPGGCGEGCGKTGPWHATRHDQHQFSGNGPGIPIVTSGVGPPADHGHPGHLYRPGHPLRKLHPSFDHPFGPSFCRGSGPC